MAMTTKLPFSVYIRKRFPRGFTLVELLTVIAIIGILAAILIPVIGTAQNSALRAKSRAQFNGYAMAITDFRNEYGFYPLGLAETPRRLNEDISVDDFRLALTGRDAEGKVDNSLNRRARAFYSFSSAEFDHEGRIVDAFENPNIFIVVDDNNSGMIKNPLGSSPANIQTKVGVYTDPTSAETSNFGWLRVTNWE